uniref:Olfactory receptor n=1 Tax=Pyxicephalus adspersus TaxID=30357 RepID=A0AAV3A4T1_PYXAD|nr:TPA: hypothetical protein GDO54_016685 [Pyxicephalus adspersus]
MKNVTMIFYLTLVGLSDDPLTIIGLFVLFLLIYLMTVFTNLPILFLVITNHHLHNPMYFFLTQVFFFLYFACSELLLLSVLSYHRYVAICQPLHYQQTMSWRACRHLALLVWVFSLIYSLIHSLCLLGLSFCGPNSIHNFFCDLPHLFQTSCKDPTINIVLMFALGGCVTLGAFLSTFLPYVRILSAIFRIRSKTGRLKAFSTCTSHLTVVFIFYGSLIFIYFIPTSNDMFGMNKFFTIIYTLINPLLNPLIYSLRNKDLKAALIRSCYVVR